MTTLAGFELGSVLLGDLELLDGGEDAFGVAALGSDSGYDLGNADPIEVALQTLLQEGAVVVTQGHNNREVVIPVLVKAGDPVALAEAEQRLFLQLERRNTLTMRYAEYDLATVFEVVTSSLAQVTDDFAEVKRGERRYNIRLVCEPASRSESLVEVEISAGGEPPSSETAVVISEADNLTGWSTTAPHTLVDGDGYVAVDNGGGQSNRLPISYTPASPFSLSATPYIYVEYLAIDMPVTKFPLAMFVNGVFSTFYPVMSVAAGAYIRSYYQPQEVSTVSTLEFVYSGYIVNQGNTNGELRINRIVRTNMTPVLGSTRQVTAAFPVLGSAPAQGSIRVRHPLSSLGTALVYTRSATDTYYNPPQRGNLIAPLPTSQATDANMWSGKISDPRDMHTFGIDAASLPEGTYDIWIRARSTGAEPVTYAWSATHVPPNAPSPVGPTESGSHQHAATGGWDVVCIGQVRLPTVQTRSGGGQVRLTFQQTSSGSSSYTFDELWLFEKQRGALTVVRVGNMRRLWLDPATLDRPRPSIYTLDRTNGSISTGDTADATYPAGLVDAFGVHEFEPGLVFTFVASNVTGPAVGVSYYPRHHTHASL